jgi:hypothetical protein
MADHELFRLLKNIVVKALEEIFVLAHENKEPWFSYTPMISNIND